MQPNVMRAVDSILGKTYELSLTKNYVSRWGAVHAIRELIQNSLDSDSPFIYSFIGEDGGTALMLNSEFSTLTPQTLLLGATSKAESETAIGSFGEGYKLALLVLLREGYDVVMRNGDLTWRPRFKFSKMFNDEIMVIDETVSSDRGNKGLTFIVSGLSESLVEQVKDSCLFMQDNIGAIKRTQYGDILLDRPGKLYVGSLFICETELRYGYNAKPQYLRLERDRQTVDTWDLKDLTLKMWYDTGEMHHVAQMLAERVIDVQYAEYNSPQILRDECYRLFRKRNPYALSAGSPEELKKMVEDGMTETVYISSSFHSVVSKSDDYKRDSSSMKIVMQTPTEALESWLRDNRSEMRTKAIVSFKSLIETSKKWHRK